MGEQDLKSKDAQWTAAWIEQQRALLSQQAAAAGPGMQEEVRAVGAKWLELGQSCLSGIGVAGAQSFASFKVGEELLDVWRNAWATTGAAQQSVSRAVSDLLGRLPPIGLAREHTEAWRELAAAQAECQHLEQELRGVLMDVQGDALNLLEQRVRERQAREEPVSGYRDLYDLWVECAEQVFAKVAHSDAYGKLQAQLGNASMRLRSRQQKVTEYALKQMDLPTRSEMNSVHLQLRTLKQQVAASKSPASRPAAKKTSRSRPASKRRAAKGRSR